MIPLSRILSSGLFSGENIGLIIAIIILIVFSAFFSSSETAYSTSNLIRLRNLADENVKGARRALRIAENYDKTLSTILVGNNLVNIASTTLAAFLFSNLIQNPTLSNILNTVVMTLIVLTFGEIFPKSLAKANPEGFALKFSGIMRVFIVIFSPITFFFTKMQKALTKQRKNNDEKVTVTEDELETIIDTMEEEGVIDAEDADLIQSVLTINDKTAYDIMTPRVDISAVEKSDDFDKIRRVFQETNFSRLPVYDEVIDHIVGILNLKDFYPVLFDNKNKKLKDIMTEPLFLNENVKVDDIIRQMQSSKKHMAVVLDEYGGTSGIVCLEDAIETMVGEIYDEHDEEEAEQMFVKVAENEYLVDAEIEITDLFEELEIENVPASDYSTLGGFLYEKVETLPEEGQEYVVDTIDEIHDEKTGEYFEKAVKVKFIIEKVEDKRVRKVRTFVDYGELKKND